MNCLVHEDSRLGHLHDASLGLQVIGKPDASWTAVAERSGDTAFGRKGRRVKFHPDRAGESGVALRFPPQSKTLRTRGGAMAVAPASWSAGGPPPLFPAIRRKFPLPNQTP